MVLDSVLKVVKETTNDKIVIVSNSTKVFFGYALLIIRLWICWRKCVVTINILSLDLMVQQIMQRDKNL
jgi:hypothetical protein